MKIKIIRRDEGYPLVDVQVPVTTDLDSEDLRKILEAHRIVIVSRWLGSSEGITAEAILHDEYKSPPKRTARKK